ncbi:MAG: XRE family transcriptional regulator [Gammaproteobacteria bacterium]|nr:XRE family transcriptional regulator [Gammaproteobacteria bacterium]
MPQVNPDILRWARETAGLTLEDAVGKLSIRDTRGAVATDRLRALETGETAPTRALLSRMAKQYRRPLLTFYLAQPPRRGNWGRDFRAPAADRSARDEALLDALVRNVQARQGLLRSAMLDDDDALVPLTFPGSATTDTPVEQLVGSIRDTLRLQLSDLRGARNPDDAFRLLRSHAEQAGVFVLVLGDLGSYHTELSVEVFRGFALADEFAPFVVVNSQDSAAARCFTLLHELVHLWLGEPGISGGDPQDPVEVSCNKVASSFLLPDEELATLRGPVSEDLQNWAASISAFAGSRNVSSSMVAYRLHRRGVIDRETWLALSGLFRSRWLEGRKRQRQQRANRDGGPTYGVLVRHSLGGGLVELASRLMASGALTTTKAGRVLGVNPRNAHTIFAAG